MRVIVSRTAKMNVCFCDDSLWRNYNENIGLFELDDDVCYSHSAADLFVLCLAVFCTVEVKLHRCGNDLNQLKIKRHFFSN